MPLYGMVSLLALLAGAPHIPYRLQLSFESTVFFTFFFFPFKKLCIVKWGGVYLK